MAREIKKRINVLDLFSGIGGFALGVENAGMQHEWLGFSEIDKYATELYKRRFPNAKELGSVKNVSYKRLKGKRIDLLTGGFPCQAFSIAGNRRGFEDTRGTMFFEIARILRDYIENGKPIPCILLENVKGLLSHDNRRTFTTIYKILTDLNYTIECQLVNTKWWLPQNRERIFIFGRYNGNPSGRKVFPIYKGSEKASELQGQFTNTITARYEAGATGSYVVESKLNSQKGKLNQICNVGDKDNQANRVYDTNGISKTLTDGGGGGAKTGLYKVHSTQTRIRKLSPKECERLQGFPDDWTEGQSDTQRYKQLGNAVSIPVVKRIIERLFNG